MRREIVAAAARRFCRIACLETAPETLFVCNDSRLTDTLRSSHRRCTYLTNGLSLESVAGPLRQGSTAIPFGGGKHILYLGDTAIREFPLPPPPLPSPYPSSSSVLNRFFTLIVQYAAEGGFMLECRTGPDSVFRLGLLAVWGCMY
jgi:hypothetical protein